MPRLQAQVLEAAAPCIYIQVHVALEYMDCETNPNPNPNPNPNQVHVVLEYMDCGSLADVRRTAAPPHRRTAAPPHRHSRQILPLPEITTCP